MNNALLTLCMVLLAAAAKAQDDYGFDSEAYANALSDAEDASTGAAVGVIILIIVLILLCFCLPIVCIIYCCYKTAKGVKKTVVKKQEV